MPDILASTLAEKQARLAVALAGLAAPPPGFDEARVARAGAALLHKRAAAAAKLLPAGWRSLGGEAGRAFRAYASAHPFPGDHAADALAFGMGACTRDSPPALVADVLSLRARGGWPVRVGRVRHEVIVVARIAGRPHSLRLRWL